MNVQLVRLWKPEDVAEDLEVALGIVDRLNPPDDLRLAVFNIASSLLSQRAQVQADPRGIVPNMAVSLPRKQ